MVLKQSNQYGVGGLSENDNFIIKISMGVFGSWDGGIKGATCEDSNRGDPLETLWDFESLSGECPVDLYVPICHFHF